MVHLWSSNYVLSIISLIITLNLLMGITNSSSHHHYVHHDCPRSDFSYTSGSTFEANLTYALLTALPTSVSLTSFSNLTIISHRDSSTDDLYALCYCWDDIVGNDRLDCVEAAGRTLLKRCHLRKEGIAWYDKCTLRYANRSILSLEEELPAYRHYNFSGVLKNLDQHKQVFENTMDVLINQAAYDGGKKLRGSATGEANLTASQLMLRGLVQCSPHIAGGRCERCLRSALNQRDGWFTPIIYLPSCSIRFDLFYSSQISPSPSPSDPSKWLKYVIPVAVIINESGGLHIGN